MPQIIRYTPDKKDILRAYLHKTFPRYSDDYLDYCIDYAFNPDSDSSAFIVLAENDCIVGCHLFFPIKAFIRGVEVKTCWGHDTYLDEQYRKECSIPFILKINRVPAFGIGVTDVNKKIQESIRTSFIPGLFTYCFVNAYAFMYNIFSSKRIKLFCPPQKLKISSWEFELVRSSADIKIPNNGFWYKDINDVDFVRDKQYLDNRFFNNKTFQYYIYTVKDIAVYFVIRPILFRGLPMLSIVDYRCSEVEKIDILDIVKAAKKISSKNHLAGVVLVSNDKELKTRRLGLITLKRELSLVANKYLNLSSNITVNVTSADADVDFMR